MAFQSGLTPVLFSRNPDNIAGYQGFTCIGLERERISDLAEMDLIWCLKFVARDMIILIESIDPLNEVSE